MNRNLDTASIASATATVARLFDNLRTVIRGRDQALRHVLAALASSGHVLLEDFPGTGKTTLAKALARSIEADFKRIQFTPDLLPSDILGVSIYHQREQEFRFQPGPVFTEVLLADEINRASPRTQSALLEAMAESQVSVDGVRRSLPDLFFVIATQNPVEFRGTYPLPEAQMDRFALSLGLGYVDPSEEVSILSAQIVRHPLEALRPCATVAQVLELRRAVAAVRISEELKRYVVDLCASTRTAINIQMGASPRASLALMKVSQALAFFDGKDFVTPGHIQDVATEVIAHRLVLAPQARFGGLTARQITAELIRKIPVPA